MNSNKLNEKNIINVVEKFLMKLENQLLEKAIELEIKDDALKWIAENGYDEKLGARPLERIINERIKKVLASEILFGKLVNGGKVIVSITENELNFEFFPKSVSKSIQNEYS